MHLGKTWRNALLRSNFYIKLTRCKLGVVHLPVVGAAALVQPCVHGRAAVAQRAGAAAHGCIWGVKVLRTLEALMIIPISVQPAVAVLPLCVRYPQIPGQISQQQAVQQAHHPGKPLRFTVRCVLWAAAPDHRVSPSYRLFIYIYLLKRSCCRCEVMSSFHHPNRFEPNAAKTQSEKSLIESSPDDLPK